MSTFLELCKDLRQEAGISGTGPAAVASQIGELKRVVDWIVKAYKDVQNKHKNWNFLRNDFSVATVSGTQTYSLTDLSLTELSTWVKDGVRVYRTASGTADEQWLTYRDWPSFKNQFLFGANRDVSGRPTHFTINPDKSLVFWPKPDAIYTVNGEYFKRAQTLTLDADEPLLPSEYHAILVWRALMSYAAYESAAELYASGQIEFNRLMSALELDQLPQIRIGGPLA